MTYKNFSENRIDKINSLVKVLAFGWAVTAVTAGVLFAGSNASAGSDSLELRRLSILDEKGVARIVIGAPKPDPQINGTRYKRRSPSNGIQFNDKNGDEIGGIGALSDGSKTFCFDGKAGTSVHERICMYVLTNGRTGFLVNDENGKERARMELTSSDGGSEFALSDGEGRARVKIGVGADGTPSIETYDKNGKILRQGITQKDD